MRFSSIFSQRRAQRKATMSRQARRLFCGFERLEERWTPSLTISSAFLFTSLDGSASDDDGMQNGILTINGDLTIKDGGSINANDPALPTNADAGPPIVIHASGNVLIEAD